VSILQNAVDSIDLGMEDYDSADPRRLISCARNISAGILLLFKAKLASLSPLGSDEVLIKQRILPVNDQGKIEWRGASDKTVDVYQIKERFKSLGITADWSRVDKIIAYRNDIEHYFSAMSKDSTRSLIANSFIVIRDFVKNHLQMDPRDLFERGTWDALINVTEVYEKEKKECTEHIESLKTKYTVLQRALDGYQCEACGSGLIDVNNQGSTLSTANFECRSCGHEWEFEEIAPKAIDDYFAHDNYRAVKDGGDVANVTCPNCNADTYILEEEACVICGSTFNRDCGMCSGTIDPELMGESGLCSYCSNLISRED
jgi:RNase P subunit RPR2